MDSVNIVWLLIGGAGSLTIAYGVQTILGRRAAASEVEETPPVQEKRRMPQHEDPFDRAFQALDESESPTDAALANNVFPLPPLAADLKPKRQPPPQEPSVSAIRTEVPNHPCRYIDGVYPSHYREGECQGTCRHNQQPGRLCFWVSNTATQCGYFHPKVVPTLSIKKKAVG